MIDDLEFVCVSQQMTLDDGAKFVFNKSMQVEHKDWSGKWIQLDLVEIGSSNSGLACNNKERCNIIIIMGILHYRTGSK